MPTAAERDTGATSQLLAACRIALRDVNPPSGACPIAGAPTNAALAEWLQLWSLQSVWGWATPDHGASHLQLLAPTPVVANGAIRKFFVGAAPVKKGARCVDPTAG